MSNAVYLDIEFFSEFFFFPPENEVLFKAILISDTHIFIKMMFSV